jgi:ribosomal protein L37E
MTEVTQREDGVEVVYNGQEYVFSLEELRCKACGSGQVKATYLEEQEASGVTALALGTECKSCGETALHVSY